MDKNKLLTKIERYQEINKHENIASLKTFLKNNQTPFTRENLFGHITCSSWIVDEKMEKALLIHNKKFDKWLQPGGHMESGETIYEAALREGVEETGVDDLKFVSDDIFDIDIHKIPENIKKGEPEHYHYDVRLITQAPNYDVSIDKEECSDFEWIDLNELKQKTQDESILRMIAKTEDFKKELDLKKRSRYKP